MQRTFRSLIQTLLTVACALSLSLTGFDLPAQAESKNASDSATPANLAATPQTKRRRARRRSRAARSTVARRSRGVVYSSSAAPVVSGEVRGKVDYIPPGGAIPSDEQAPPRPEPTPREPMPGEIRGGILNGKAISLPTPVYPAFARSVRASGVVVVEVTVDERGIVISGRALSGHPLLQAAAVDAAYQARFAPTKLSGRPVKVLGTIHYHFVQ